MKHQEVPHDGIQEAVRRALTEELPKALESVLTRLSDQTDSQTKQPELISRKHAASMLGLSVQTVAKMITEGTLSPVRLGRRVLVRESDVRSVIDSRSPYRTRCPK